MNHLLNEGTAPKSMYQFAKSLKLKESEIYEHFASFEAIEAHVFQTFFDNTLALLDKDRSYKSYGAKDKLISFYFTFFELLKVNRSYVLLSLTETRDKIESLKKLSSLRSSFKNYISSLNIPSLDFKKPNLEAIKNKGIAEMAWGQLLVTMTFWMNDSSKGFEKTDIFIEKGLKAWFEVMKIEPIESIIDFGKFIIKEKLGARS